MRRFVYSSNKASYLFAFHLAKLKLSFNKRAQGLTDVKLFKFKEIEKGRLKKSIRDL